MGLVVLLILLLLLVLVGVPIWVFVKISGFTSTVESLQRRVALLDQTVTRLQEKLAAVTAASAALPATPAEPAPTIVTPPAVTPRSVPPAGVPATLPQAAPVPAIPAAPPPLPTISPVAPTEAVPPVMEPVVSTDSTRPPIVPPPPTPEPEPVAPRIDWEQFMGAKLFAWLGGLAALFAVGFFVKYSFEHDLIPPQVRVAIGFALSAALIAGGLMMNPERFRITAQVLCATGVSSLYAVTFACHAVYHFAFFGPLATFALMTLVTATAFLLAVRMEAQVVAILGLLGGFLTPVMLSTGQDNPSGLFGYIALLDAGLIAVALHRRWAHLVSLATAGTIVMQIGWALKFFDRAPMLKAPIAAIVCVSFCVLFFLATEIARRLQRSSGHLTWSTVALAVTAFGFALAFQSYPGVATRPGLVFGFLFFTDLILIALAWREPGASRFHSIGGGAVFAILAIWTASHLTDALLPWALGAYLGFAVLHAAFPLVLARTRPDEPVGWFGQIYPPVALLLMLVPLLKLDAVSLLFWPAVLAIDVLAVLVALLSTSLLALGIVLIFTLAGAGICIFRATEFAATSTSLLLIIGGFSVFFFAAGLFLFKRLGGKAGTNLLGDSRAQIPAFAALLPFVLLVMMGQRLAFANPSPLFGFALLCVVLVLGLSRLLGFAWLPLCALAGVAAVEYSWHARSFAVDAAGLTLAWYIWFHLVFAVFPFAFRRSFAATTGPWAIAALSGLAQFPLVYWLVQRAWPNSFLGVLPALFSLVPLASLLAVLRSSTLSAASSADGAAPSIGQGAQLNRLAWFGGAALFFVTLIFPIQFERQWITIGWALEGAALLWLFHRVPHAGLRATGAVLLVVAFARLALNPKVLSYHLRSDTPIFNWYLYAYGVAIACLFIGARLLAPPRERVLGCNGPIVLNTLGTVLTFLLLNIEIADYFSAAGSTLTFQFAGNLARDLAYTVGWALFALALLVAGIWRRSRAARYAAIALLSVTLLKLFFHDLSELGQLYRVGALVVVAVVAIVASFLYQRFVPSEKSRETAKS